MERIIRSLLKSFRVMVAEIERKIIQKFKDKESFTQSTHY